MNDLPLHLNETFVELFADDATQYVSGKTIEAVQNNINNDLQPILLWNDENKMILNETKTKAMVIASKRKLSEIPEDLNITINESIIKTIKSEKLLGVVFDQNLSWSDHIDYVCKKITQRLGILRRIKHYLTLEARLACYNCLIQSLMEYCCVVWGNASKDKIDRIHRLQKRAARLILDRGSKEPSLPLFMELGWLPIHERIKYFRAITVFKALNDLAPEYIKDLIKPFHKIHNKNTRGASNNLQLPLINSKSGQRRFAFMASQEWNDLENTIKSEKSLSAFKAAYLKTTFQKLKKHYENVKTYFYTIF